MKDFDRKDKVEIGVFAEVVAKTLDDVLTDAELVRDDLKKLEIYIDALAKTTDYKLQTVYLKQILTLADRYQLGSRQTRRNIGDFGMLANGMAEGFIK